MIHSRRFCRPTGRARGICSQRAPCFLRASTAGAVSRSIAASTMIAMMSPTRIHKVMLSPSRSATLPAALGAKTPPRISLIPMVSDSAVAVLSGPTISAWPAEKRR
jgi:hypothetical protein